MRALVAASLAAVLAGCLAPAVEDAIPAEVAQATVPDVLEWSGHVLTSEKEEYLHYRPTEDVLWPLQQEGVLVEVPEGVTEMEVGLSWDGPGEFMIMLHSHKAEGTNVYVEHVTELDAENPKCLRVPTVDVTAGVWQVMVHSRDALRTDFTLSVQTVGGLARLLDERHGHDPRDGDFDIDDHPVEACTFAPAAP